MKAVTEPVFDPRYDPDTCNFNWQSLAAVQCAIPDELHYWLALPSSLTQALRQRSDAFSVEVLDQRHVSLTLPIDGFSDLLGPCPMFSRKVLLKHGAIPWVAAHTLIPERSLERGGLEQLTQLANQPLGELLFATPGVTKDNLQVCATERGWGRRARYLLNHQPLLVSEFFLPELIAYEHERLTLLHQAHPT
ncbi:chorismate--pyruvate lyase family protein [Reinekea sp.]|jgi:chorismate--pyruvate lyase|uniref:chorismate--pyruvate lyase family protein n=1 Tax=Reinekea sp. TaxID=1970455 RepID=UPI002A7F0A2E|nr:chorismate lyase [Reinekea sp.]